MKALDQIREAVRQRPRELVEAREKGMKVAGYFCCYVPEEIIYALGFIPIRLGIGGNPELMDKGAAYVSANNCAFIRECVGLFADGKDPYVANLDIVIVGTSCVQQYRLSELVRYYFNPNVEILRVPRGFYDPAARVFFREEVKDFTRRLGKLAGYKLDNNLLRESIELYREIREVLNELYTYQGQECHPISWAEVLEVIQAGFYLDRRHYLDYLRELLEEVKKEAARVALPDNRPRLFLTGTLIAPQDTKLINLVEELGGRIVADDLCTGQRFYQQMLVKEFSLEGVADGIMGRVPCASQICLKPVDDDRRFTNMLNLIEEYKAEGVLYHSLRFCDPFALKAVATKNLLGDRLHLPFLQIHTEYSPSDLEAIKTRVEGTLDIIYVMRQEKENFSGG